MRHILWLIGAMVLLNALPAFAQESSAADATEALLPTAYRLEGVGFEFQGWNNCGPATITNALTFFGYGNSQQRAAEWLKPNREDKNVSPWQMAQFVNEQVGELPVESMVRHGGDVDLMKALLANNFPVIMEKGYDPEPDRLGWMGHYLLLVGYDDAAGHFITHDSYIGANITYTYAYLNRFWQHFNYTYVVLYQSNRRAELEAIMGTDFGERQNAVNALEIAREEAVANDEDAHAWFNMGTNFVALEMWEEAAVAYDQARNLGLPWRMMWYQFGPYEAYHHVGRYGDMIALAQQNLNDGGGHFVEETFYYGGLAREGLGEYGRALSNYEAAVGFNPNFIPAIEALADLQARINNGEVSL